ncbi:MAG: AAA family ATPase, partial [Bacillota bacterium]|nr:AAA family ATPase [Bacillota bacterium]
MDKLRGTVERLVFRKADSPYTVLRFRTRDEQLVTVVGNFTSITPGQVLELSGEYTQHAQYGRQFAAKSYEEKVPNDIVGLEKYLGSGLIKGIGPETARKIVAHFGADTLQVLDEAPERLPEVPGIGEAKAKLICASQAEQKQVRRVMIFLQGHGISPGYATRIYRTYGAECEEQIRRNPYQVADNVHGIGFKTADKLARELGIEGDDPRRVAAGIRYLLREAEDQGHCYLPLPILEERADETLQVSQQLVPRVVDALVTGRSLVRVTVGDECRIYRTEIYFAERAVAAKLRELSRVQLEITADGIDLSVFEAAGGIKLAEEQKQAIAVALQHGITVITGGPGTGKTTLVRALLHVCQERNMSVYLAAPTGRAAKRLSESTGQEAKTLHRLLEFTVAGGAPTFARNEESPLKCDMLVLDEASMIDLSLMNSLLKAVPLGCGIVLVGDIDQLPPVGAGNVLRDIISSGLVPAVRLQTIFRQAQQSLIVYNAHRINKGEFPYLATRGRDFQFISMESPEGILESITTLVSSELPKLFKFHPITDIQVLSPMRKTLTGVDNL